MDKASTHHESFPTPKASPKVYFQAGNAKASVSGFTCLYDNGFVFRAYLCLQRIFSGKGCEELGRGNLVAKMQLGV